MDQPTFLPSDRVYRWWDSGALGAEQQALTIIRANRVTYTVRTDQGSEFRLPKTDIVGFVDWES